MLRLRKSTEKSADGKSKGTEYKGPEATTSLGSLSSANCRKLCAILLSSWSIPKPPPARTLLEDVHLIAECF